MNRLAKYAIAALVAGIPASASAQVEYTLEIDTAFPSVLYVEFDPATMPQIYTAPGSGSGMPVIRGGSVEGDLSGAAPAQPVDKVATSSNSKKSSESGALDDRVRSRVDDLVGADGQKLEDLMIDREIEDRVLDRLQD